jgi:hypothetical protein
VQRLKLSDELEIYIQSNFGEIGNSLFTHVGKSLREGNPEAITQLGDRAIAPLALYILNDLKDSKEIHSSSSNPSTGKSSIESSKIISPKRILNGAFVLINPMKLGASRS